MCCAGETIGCARTRREMISSQFKSRYNRAEEQSTVACQTAARKLLQAFLPWPAAAKGRRRAPGQPAGARPWRMVRDASHFVHQDAANPVLSYKQVVSRFFFILSRLIQSDRVVLRFRLGKKNQPFFVRDRYCFWIGIDWIFRFFIQTSIKVDSLSRSISVCFDFFNHVLDLKRFLSKFFYICGEVCFLGFIGNCN